MTDNNGILSPEEENQIRVEAAAAAGNLVDTFKVIVERQETLTRRVEFLEDEIKHMKLEGIKEK